MSYTQEYWPDIAFQHAASIETTYCYLTSCLQSHKDCSDVIQCVHKELIWKHRELLSLAMYPSDPGQKAVRDTYLVGRLWDTTRRCINHLNGYTSPEMLQGFTQQTFRELVLVHESIHHNRSVWAEFIAFLAWTAAEMGADEPDTWRLIARRWYRSASHTSPGSGKYLLNLALVDEQPLNELYYFSKSLVSLDAVSVSTAKLKPLPIIYKTVESTAEILFVKATRLLLLQATKNDVDECVHELQIALSSDEKVLELWHKGATVACIMCAALLDFGDSSSHALQAMSELRQWQHDPAYIIIRESMRLEQWRLYRRHVSTGKLSPLPFNLHPCASVYESTRGVSTAKLFYLVASTALGARCYSFTYILLSFIFALSHSPRGLVYLELAIPWRKLVRCLNQMRLEVRGPPISGPAAFLREDVMLQGYMWSWMLFRSGGICESLDDFEAPCVTQLRLQRCMHLAKAIVKIQRYISLHQECGYHLSRYAKELEQNQGLQ